MKHRAKRGEYGIVCFSSYRKTKSTLILRDLDILKEVDKRKLNLHIF